MLYTLRLNREVVLPGNIRLAPEDVVLIETDGASGVISAAVWHPLPNGLEAMLAIVASDAGEFVPTPTAVGQAAAVGQLRPYEPPDDPEPLGPSPRRPRLVK